MFDRLQVSWVVYLHKNSPSAWQGWGSLDNRLWLWMLDADVVFVDFWHWGLTRERNIHFGQVHIILRKVNDVEQVIDAIDQLLLDFEELEGCELWVLIVEFGFGWEEKVAGKISYFLESSGDHRGDLFGFQLRFVDFLWWGCQCFQVVKVSLSNARVIWENVALLAFSTGELGLGQAAAHF